MSATRFLFYGWWLFLAAAPFVVIVLADTIRDLLSARAAWTLAGIAAFIAGVALTPFSLRGILADQAVLAAAYVLLCIAAAALPAGVVRYALVLIFFVGAAGGWIVGFLAAWGEPSRTEPAGCDLVARLSDTSSFSTDFTSVQVLWRPGLSPIEYALEEQRIPTLFSETQVHPERSELGCVVLVNESGMLPVYDG